MSQKDGMMNLKMEFRKFIENYNSEEERAAAYFAIGHGDDNQPYVVWAYINGNIEASPVVKDPLAMVTHGTMWGHDVTNYTYKGRFEPRTGILSIVRPNQFREIPTSVINALRAKFNIKDIKVF